MVLALKLYEQVFVFDSALKIVVLLGGNGVDSFNVMSRKSEFARTSENESLVPMIGFEIGDQVSATGKVCERIESFSVDRYKALLFVVALIETFRCIQSLNLIFWNKIDSAICNIVRVVSVKKVAFR